MALTPSPDRDVATIWFVRGSIRVTVPSALSQTHTLPAPTAIPLGPLPIGIVATVRAVSGSSRVISRPEPAIQTAFCRHRHRPRLLRVPFRRIQPD